MRDFERGQWDAFNRVLALLNTYDDRVIDKHVIYRDVMKLRPLESNKRHEVFRRIMDRVRVDVDSDCWVWTGPNSGKGRGGGYPRMSLWGHTSAVHRVMYALVHGMVPGKKHIDHICCNRLCVNPAHLQMTTHKKNCRLRDQRRGSNEKSSQSE